MSGKIAFVYDHKFFIQDQKVYSSGAFNYNVWKRFLRGFDNVTVFGTLLPLDDDIETSKLNRVDGERVSFEHVDYISSISNYLQSLFFPQNDFRRLLKGFDAVVIRVPGRISFNTYWTAKKMDLPIGLEVVGCPWDAYWNHGTLKGKILAPIAYWRMKKILRNATHAVYVTEDFLQKKYPTNGKSIHASNVDIQTPSEEVLKARIKKIKNDSAIQSYKIGIMGSLDVRYKGHFELLKAISLIKSSLPPVKIEIVGPGNSDWLLELAKKLKIASLVEIKGKLPSGQPILKWLDTLDMYVHPSKQEGLPRSIIEAMSRGCPVLASSVAGIPELLDNSFLHNPGDYNTLASHFEKYVSDKKALIRMAEKNFKVAKGYDSSILEERRESFWQDFANQINTQN